MGGTKYDDKLWGKEDHIKGFGSINLPTVGENVLGHSVRNRRATPAHPERIYISVRRGKLFRISTDTLLARAL